MAQTRQFLLRMGTYGPDLLDDQGGMPTYRERVGEVITPKFKASFEKEAGVAEQLVAQGQAARVAEVFATGVSDVDPDSATALVAGTFTDTYVVEGEAVEGEPVPFRIEVSLVKIGGEWLVDDFTPADRHRRARAGATVSTTGLAPSLYDLLDVAPGAPAGEIRAAWRSAIDGLEPGDRRFRAYNAAAETLLDHDRRAAYDAELGAEGEPDEPEGRRRFRDGPGGPQPPADESSTPADESTPPASAERRPAPGWLLVALALLTAGAVSLAAWLWSQPSDAAVSASTREAQAAAERAIVPVLSYDARTLDDDQAAGAAYLTGDYRKDYDQLYEVIRQNAPRVGTTVSAEVVASGIVRSGPDDPDRVEVLVFVNRPTTNKRSDEPVVYRDQVTVTMENVDGSWLIDGLRTSPAGG